MSTFEETRLDRPGGQIGSIEFFSIRPVEFLAEEPLPRAGRPARRLPPALLVEHRADVLLAPLERQLPAQREPLLVAFARQRAVLDGGEHGAAGLRGVAAVAEAARLRDLLDVGERGGEAVVRVEQAELAHAGR